MVRFAVRKPRAPLTSHNRDYGGITKLIDRAHLMRARLERSVSVCAMGSTSPLAAGHLAQSSAETRRAASTAAPHRHGYSSHRNPDQTVDDLVDIERRAYRNLPTALLYRSRYIADCTCRGNPWDEVSIARHRSYAKLHKQTVSDKTAAALPSVKSERRAKRSDHWAQTG